MKKSRYISKKKPESSYFLRAVDNEPSKILSMVKALENDIKRKKIKNGYEERVKILLND